MFAFDCPCCGDKWLIFESQVTAIKSTENGIVVSLVCWCGEPGELVTGAAGKTTREPEPVAA